MCVCNSLSNFPTLSLLTLLHLCTCVHVCKCTDMHVYIPNTEIWAFTYANAKVSVCTHLYVYMYVFLQYFPILSDHSLPLLIFLSISLIWIAPALKRPFLWSTSPTDPWHPLLFLSTLVIVPIVVTKATEGRKGLYSLWVSSMVGAHTAGAWGCCARQSCCLGQPFRSTQSGCRSNEHQRSVHFLLSIPF